MRFFAPAHIGRWGWMALAASCFVIMATPAYSQCDFSPSGTLGPFPIGPTDIPLTPLSGTPPFTFSYAPGAPVIPGFRISNAPAVPRRYGPGSPATLIGMPLNPDMTALSSFASTIRMSDSAGCVVDKDITLQFSPLDIVPGVFEEEYNGLGGDLESAGRRYFIRGYSVGETTRFPFRAVGGAPPYTFSVAGGTLPPGILLNMATGDASGVLEAAGSYDFEIRVTDSRGHTAKREFTWSISTIRLITPSNRILPNAIEGQPYSFQLAAVSSSGNSVTFSGSIPGGLSLSPSGLLSGVPAGQSSGPVWVSITVSDGIETTSVPLSLFLDGPPVKQLAGLCGGAEYQQLVGVSGGLYVSATGGVPPYSFELAPGSSLPDGALLSKGRDSRTSNPNAAYVYGRVRKAGTYDFTIRISDSVGNQVMLPIRWRVAQIGVWNTRLPADPSQSAVLGKLSSMETIPLGGREPYTITADGLPSGLAIDNQGRVSGSPQETCHACEGVIRILDSSTPAIETSVAVGIAVAGENGVILDIRPRTVRVAPVGKPVEKYLEVCCGTPSPRYVVNITNGALAPGLTLLGAGQFDDGGNVSLGAKLTGIPQAVGASEVMLRVEDGAGNYGQRLLRVLASDLDFAVTALPAGRFGEPYSAQLQAVGGTPPYRFCIAFGSLPAGLSLDPATGVISGVPTGPGTGVTFAVTDSAGFTVTSVLALNVANNPPSFLTTSLPPGELDKPYYYQIQTTGGVPPLSFSLSWSPYTPPPQGITLDPQTGVLSGTPTISGRFYAQIQVIDSWKQGVSTGFQLEIQGSLALTNYSLPDAFVGIPYSHALGATGGTPPYTFVALSSSSGIPQGLTLDSSTGVLSGIPVRGGTHSWPQRVVDARGSFFDRIIGMYVRTDVRLVNTSLAPALVGVTYSETLLAAGSFPPFSIRVSGRLPSGVSFDTGTNKLSGTPTEAGTFPLWVYVSDANGGTASRPLNLVVLTDVALLNPALPPATAGVAYSATLRAAGSYPPFAIAVSGNLPGGLSFDSARGQISGIANVTGSFPLTLTVTDSKGGSASYATTLQVNSFAIAGPSLLPVATVGREYSYKFEASPPGDYRWHVDDYLPCCLALDPATGMVSGFSVLEGFFIVRVRATDASGNQVQRYFTLVANSLNVAQTLTGLPIEPIIVGSVGQTLGWVFRIAGGAPPYTVSVVSGNLPAGLSLQPAGDALGLGHGSYAIVGKSLVPGRFTVRLQFTDSSGLTTEREVTLWVDPTPAPNATAAAVLGSPFNYQLTGAAAYALSDTAGNALPPGLSLSSDGRITGVPTSSGEYSYFVDLINPEGISRRFFFTRVFSALNEPGVFVNAPTFSLESVGRAIRISLSAYMGTTPYSWQVLDGTMPPGLALYPDASSSTKATLEGLLTTRGDYRFRIKVTDAAGKFGIRELRIVVTELREPGPVNLPFTASLSIPAGRVGDPYSFQLICLNGQPPCRFALKSPSFLPQGLTFTQTGLLSGTPMEAGNFLLSVGVTDARGETYRIDKPFLIFPSGRSIGIQGVFGPDQARVALPSATKDASYRFALSDLLVQGQGRLPVTWTLDSGQLPAGLAISAGADGVPSVLAGTPTTIGQSDFTLLATDADGRQHLIRAQLYVGNLALAAPSLPPAATGVTYSQTIAVSGGAPPYQFTLLPGSLVPPGLTVDPQGNVSGTPTALTDYPGILYLGITAADRSGMQTQIRLNGASALAPDGQIGVSGGSVADVATGAQASLTVPPGVLPDNTGVTIHVLDPVSNPAPSAFGNSASYFVQFTLAPPPPYPLPSPGATITLPLLSPQAPGTTLVLFTRAPDGTLTPVLDASGAQISGIVDATGLCAKFTGITHFSVFFAGRRIQLTPVITAPQAPQPVNVPVSVEASIEKDGFFDKAVWDWGDGTTSTSTSLSGLRTSHAYLKPGVYVVRLELFLKDFLLGSAEFRYLVIYDPAAGFVTGGGWIESPPGAVATAPAVKGKAIIGFEARYKPGEASPSGSVQFQFQAADLRFKGEKYDWLVIEGSRAVLRGSGSLNGTPGYAFLLSAADDVPEAQGKVDKIRLRIWRTQSEAVVYDTQPGEPDNAMPSLLLQGGTLTIHSLAK